MTEKRSQEEIINECTRLAEEVAAPLDLEIVDVKMSQAGRRKSLQVTIYSRSHAVGLGDCERVSRQLETLLDQRADSGRPLIEGSYVLEVQSPGIERELSTAREFRIFSGQRVFLRGKDKLGDLGQEIVGILRSAENNRLTISEPVAAPGTGGKRTSGHKAPGQKAKAKSGHDGGGEEKVARFDKHADLTIDIKQLSLVKLFPQEEEKKQKQTQAQKSE